MGNRALRYQLRQKLKDRGLPTRLYCGSRWLGLSFYNADFCREMLRLLSFAPGDLFNDCDGFNHRCAGYCICRLRWSNKLVVLHLDQLVRDDGIRSCGCPSGPDDPWSVEQIEAFYKERLLDVEYVEYEKKQGWWRPKDEALRTALLNGRPICTPEGLPLP